MARAVSQPSCPWVPLALTGAAVTAGAKPELGSARRPPLLTCQSPTPQLTAGVLCFHLF